MAPRIKRRQWDARSSGRIKRHGLFKLSSFPNSFHLIFTTDVGGWKAWYTAQLWGHAAMADAALVSACKVLGLLRNEVVKP